MRPHLPVSAYHVKVAWTQATYVRFYAEKVERRGGRIVFVNCQVPVFSRGEFKSLKLPQQEITDSARQGVIYAKAPVPSWFEASPPAISAVL